MGINFFQNERDKTLDENYILHGIVDRSEIGFLTIFEHYKYMEVGSYMKSPYYPIWIVCKEYHYSVIFCNQSSALMKSEDVGIIFIVILQMNS